MNDPRLYLMEFLAAIERVTSSACSLHLAMEPPNKTLRFALSVGRGDRAPMVYIDEGDLAKPIDILVRECTAILATLQPKKASSS